MEPKFIKPKERTLEVAQHWKCDNTIGPPKGRKPRIIRDLDKYWLEWLLEAPRFDGQDGFLLQARGRSGVLFGRRAMREKVAEEIRAAQLEAGMLSMETGKPFPRKHLRLIPTVQHLERSPGEFVTIQVSAGHANLDHFSRKFSAWTPDPDGHEQMESTLPVLDGLGAINANPSELKKLLDAWERLGGSA